LEYTNGAFFFYFYTGTRAAHASPFGWSGHWTFHGEKGDLRRDGGHLQLFRKGECVEDLNLQDLHPGLIEDDRIQFDAQKRLPRARIENGYKRQRWEHGFLWKRAINLLALKNELM